MKTLLLTGHLGFAGTMLRDWIPRSPWASSLRLLTPRDDFDLLDPASVDAAVRDARPDWVLHLAAQSHVPTALADPVGTLQVNLIGTTRLLQSIAAFAPAARLLFVSSGDVYGQVDPQALPIRETRPPAPRNPYAVSKVAGELMCRQFALTTGLDVVIARPFNHTGPGQRPDFVLSGFARLVAQAGLGLIEPRLPVGNLDVVRDFLHGTDLCEGYLALLARGRSGETYNLCSGRGRSLRELLDGMLARHAPGATWYTDPARLRPGDPSLVVGDPSRACADTGWRPHRPIEPLLDELVEQWKERLSE